MFFGKKANDDKMLGEIDIQTMGDDLKQKPAPAPAPAIPQPMKAEPPAAAPATIKFENAAPKTEPQPFLKQNFDLGKKAPNEPSEAIEKSNPFFEEKKGSAPVYIKENAENKPKKGINFGRILLIVGIILVLSLIAGGGYWFWLNSQKTAVVEVPPVPEVTIPEPKVEPTPTPTPVIPEVPKPKYLNIDVNNLTASQIQEKLISSLQTALAAPAGTGTEYIISDLNNNPIGFKAFASKIGIKFSTLVLADLTDQFSFYTYNDNGNIGIGLAIDALNEAKLKTALKNSEPSLVKILDPLLSLIESTALNKKVVFTAATYKNIDDNYFNIVSKEKLSLDYGVGYKKLIIGTTMLTFRKVVDNVELAQNPPTAITPAASVPATDTNSLPISDTPDIPESPVQ